jgi:hypothetical protein
MAFAIRLPVFTEIRHGTAEPYGGQHIMEITPRSLVIENSIAGDKRKAHLFGDLLKSLQHPFVVRATMEPGHDITAVAKNVAPSVQFILLLFRLVGIEQRTRQKSLGVLGDVVKCQPAIALRSASFADGQQTRQPTVSRAIRCQKNDWRTILGRDFCSNQQLQSERFRRRVRSHDSGQTVPIGDGQCRILKCGGALDQFIGM